MGLPASLDKSTPKDTDNPSAGAAEIREFKAFIQDYFNITDTISYTASPLSEEVRGFVNVREYPYNAVGDGVADDTAAIQAAITAAAGTELVIPPGTYLHSGLTIASAMRIRGVATMAGAQSMLSYTGTGTGLTITGNSVTLQDLVLQTATGAIGVDHSNTLYHRFLNVYVLGNSLTQYLADNSYYIKWIDGTIQGKNGTSGTTAGITSTVNFNANRIDGVRFLMGIGATDYWTALKINSAGVSGTSSGSTILDTIFDGGYAGGWAIDVYGGTTGLTITGSRQEGNGQGFLRQADSSFGISVLGGTVQGSTGVPCPRLFDLSGGDVTIQGVDIREATEGIHLGATARRITELNNSWTNVGTKLSTSEGLTGILSMYDGTLSLRGGHLQQLDSSGATGYAHPLYLGTYALWVASDGKLYIKSGTPTSDTDGTVVGTQT
jgi:hypothetical protein